MGEKTPTNFGLPPEIKAALDGYRDALAARGKRHTLYMLATAALVAFLESDEMGRREMIRRAEDLDIRPLDVAPIITPPGPEAAPGAVARAQKGAAIRAAGRRRSRGRRKG